MEYHKIVKNKYKRKNVFLFLFLVNLIVFIRHLLWNDIYKQICFVTISKTGHVSLSYCSYWRSRTKKPDVINRKCTPCDSVLIRLKLLTTINSVSNLYKHCYNVIIYKGCAIINNDIISIDDVIHINVKPEVKKPEIPIFPFLK